MNEWLNKWNNACKKVLMLWKLRQAVEAPQCLLTGCIFSLAVSSDTFSNRSNAAEKHPVKHTHTHSKVQTRQEPSCLTSQNMSINLRGNIFLLSSSSWLGLRQSEHKRAAETHLSLSVLHQLRQAKGGNNCSSTKDGRPLQGPPKRHGEALRGRRVRSAVRSREVPISNRMLRIRLRGICRCMWDFLRVRMLKFNQVVT